MNHPNEKTSTANCPECRRNSGIVDLRLEAVNQHDPKECHCVHCGWLGFANELLTDEDAGHVAGKPPSPVM